MQTRRRSTLIPNTMLEEDGGPEELEEPGECENCEVMKESYLQQKEEIFRINDYLNENSNLRKLLAISAENQKELKAKLADAEEKLTKRHEPTDNSHKLRDKLEFYQATLKQKEDALREMEVMRNREKDQRIKAEKTLVTEKTAYVGKYREGQDENKKLKKEIVQLKRDLEKSKARITTDDEDTTNPRQVPQPRLHKPKVPKNKTSAAAAKKKTGALLEPDSFNEGSSRRRQILAQQFGGFVPASESKKDLESADDGIVADSEMESRQSRIMDIEAALEFFYALVKSVQAPPIPPLPPSLEEKQQQELEGNSAGSSLDDSGVFQRKRSRPVAVPSRSTLKSRAAVTTSAHLPPRNSKPSTPKIVRFADELPDEVPVKDSDEDIISKIVDSLVSSVAVTIEGESAASDFTSRGGFSGERRRLGRYSASQLPTATQGSDRIKQDRVCDTIDSVIKSAQTLPQPLTPIKKRRTKTGRNSEAWNHTASLAVSEPSETSTNQTVPGKPNIIDGKTSVVAGTKEKGSDRVSPSVPPAEATKSAAGTVELVTPVKRGRGRPKKNSVTPAKTTEKVQVPKKMPLNPPASSNLSEESDNDADLVIDEGAEEIERKKQAASDEPETSESRSEATAGPAKTPTKAQRKRKLPDSDSDNKEKRRKSRESSPPARGRRSMANIVADIDKLNAVPIRQERVARRPSTNPSPINKKFPGKSPTEKGPPSTAVGAKYSGVADELQKKRLRQGDSYGIKSMLIKVMDDLTKKKSPGCAPQINDLINVFSELSGEWDEWKERVSGGIAHYISTRLNPPPDRLPVIVAKASSLSREDQTASGILVPAEMKVISFVEELSQRSGMGDIVSLVASHIAELLLLPGRKNEKFFASWSRIYAALYRISESAAVEELRALISGILTWQKNSAIVVSSLINIGAVCPSAAKEILISKTFMSEYSGLIAHHFSMLGQGRRGQVQIVFDAIVGVTNRVDLLELPNPARTGRDLTFALVEVRQFGIEDGSDRLLEVHGESFKLVNGAESAIQRFIEVFMRAPAEIQEEKVKYIFSEASTHVQEQQVFTLLLLLFRVISIQWNSYLLHGASEKAITESKRNSERFHALLGSVSESLSGRTVEDKEAWVMSQIRSLFSTSIPFPLNLPAQATSQPPSN